MSSQHNTECGWTGPLPAFQEKKLCQQCQRQCSAGEVVRCRLNGPPEPVVQIPPPPKDIKAFVSRPKLNSGIGDCVKAKMDSLGLRAQEGCPCKDIQKGLNQKSADEVQQEISSIAQAMLDNTKYLEGKTGKLVRLVSWFAPGMAKSEIESILADCVKSHRMALESIQTETGT